MAARLRADGIRGRTVQLKVRYGDFTTVTRSRTLASPTDRGTELVDEAWAMLTRLPLERGVRLLGVGVANLTDEVPVRQLTLDDAAADASAGHTGAAGGPDGWDAANRAVDEVRSRFGRGLIGPARLAGRRGGPGERRWGPDEKPAGDGAAGDESR